MERGQVEKIVQSIEREELEPIVRIRDKTIENKFWDMYNNGKRSEIPNFLMSNRFTNHIPDLSKEFLMDKIKLVDYCMDSGLDFTYFQKGNGSISDEIFYRCDIT